MIKGLGMIAGGAMLVIAVPATAQESEGGNLSLGVTAGTLGIGPEAGLRLNKTIGLRANGTFLSVNGSYDSDDLEFDGSIDLRSFGAMVDLYPFGGSFRISGGARINRNRAELVATPTGDTEIGDETYTREEIGTLTGRAKVPRFAPQATLGWGGSLRPGLALGLEAGVLFQGSVELEPFESTGTLANDPDFQRELEEQRQTTQDDINDYKLYPILQFGLKYRF